MMDININLPLEALDAGWHILQRALSRLKRVFRLN